MHASAKSTGQNIATAGELAGRVHGTVVGDETTPVASAATLEQATPSELSWLGDLSPKLLERAAASNAAVLLVPSACEPIAGKTLIKVPDPDAALCTLLTVLAPPANRVPDGIDHTARVSPSATVDGVAIGPNVFVGHNTVIAPGTQLHPGVYIGPDSDIGRDCVLWPNVVVRERTSIGHRVIIHPNATIGADGFGYLQRDGRHVKIPQIGSVVIGDDVEIGAGTTIDRARTGVTRIGVGTKIDNLNQIGHNVTIGNHCIIVAQCALAGSVTFGNHVVIAGQSGVADHCTIGDGTQIAAKSTAMHDIAAGQVVRGNPAVDHHQFLRQQATVRKLPKWIDRLRDLIKRVDDLESRNPDQ